MLTTLVYLYIITFACEIAPRIGVWLSLARAPGLGPGGRRFESCHPDLEINNYMRVWFNGRTSAFQAEYVGSIPITRSSIAKYIEYVSVAQLDRATAF